MDDFQEKYSALLKRIAAVRQKEKFVSLVSGIFYFLTISAAGMLFFVLLEHVFNFSSHGRKVIDLLLGLIIAAVGIYRVGMPVFSILFRKNHPSDTTIAQKIGDHFPSIGDKLVNTIQVFPIQFNNVHGYSPDLINQSLAEIDQKVAKLDFNASVSTRAIRRSARLLGGVAALYGLIAIFYLSVFQQAGYRLLHPDTEFTRVPDFQISVSPGNVQKLKNEPVELVARVSGKVPEKLQLNLKEVNAEAQLSHTLFPDNENVFKFTIEHLQDSTEYYFSVDNFSTPRYLISVVELPLVRYLQLKVTPPSYSRIKSEFLEENVGDISCLKGSRVNLTLHANKRLRQAALVFDNNKKVNLSVTANRASGAFRVSGDGSYHVRLVDIFGLENRDPIEYRISVVPDIYPTISITYPGRDVDITEDMQLTLNIEAEDDFGFSDLRLGYKIIKAEPPFADTSVKYISLPIEGYNREKILVEYNWDLTTLDLFAGDVVRYFAEVFDNDNVSGPKSTRSLVYSARFPSLEEIFAEVNQEQQETYDDFEGLYEKSKDLKQTIEKLVEEIKQNPELQWEEKKQIEDVLEKQKQLEQSLEQVQQQLDQMIERMERNDLLSLETLQKYQDLQKLLNEVMSDELKELIEKLNKSAQQLDQELVRQAMEQLNFTQDEFLKNIEKTLNILKRLQIEQKLDELVKRAEQLLEQQTNLNEQMNPSASQDQQNQLAKQQQELKNQAADLLSETNQLKTNMGEFLDMPSDKVEAALQQMEKEGLLDNMNRAKTRLQQGNMSGAQQSGKMAQNSLSEMFDLLSSAKQDLIESQKQQVMAALRNISHKMLQLSQAQENLANQSRGLNRNSPRINDVADKQQNLASALSRVTEELASLSQKTFFVSPQMGRAVGQSLQQMAEALAQLEARNTSAAARSQQRSMISLNEAIKQIMSAMNSLASASSASGMEQLMQQLAQMAGQQQGINQQTLQLGMGQQMSLAQQAAMARLAAQQEALRKSMEQLAREYGERSDILGRLDQIGREMADVVNDLQQKKVSRRTINRQQRILQRLLDAQKSVRKQDYSRKRRAQTAKKYLPTNPGNMPADLGERNLQIQRDLLKALKEGYTRDYQELIRKYFEALMKESMENAEKN